MSKRLLSVAAAAVVAAGLVTAGAAAPSAPGGDLSASVTTQVTPAVEQFVATGVLPANVSGEPGIWNFAGPAAACPGPGWNCVTLGIVPVTQVGTVNVLQCVGTACVGSTQTGHANTFECTPAGDVTFSTNTADLQACGIVQTGTDNDAKCVQKKKTVPFVRQRCSITQTGRDNSASIVQVIEQTGGSTQGAVQEAGVSQTATASKNQLQVDQEIKQLTETGLTQDQDAYQVVTGPYLDDSGPATSDEAVQTAAGAGDNQAQIKQKQIQRAKGGTTQTQNDGLTTFTAPEDCDTENFFSPDQPHACANLDQVSGSGDNQSQIGQELDEEATTGAVALDQTQGYFDGGLDGLVHQETTSPGSSQNQADQAKKQVLVGASGSNQFQFDPASCCGFFSQLGGDDNDEQIDQKSEQKASEAEAIQELELSATSNSPSGKCEISHDAKNNSDQTSESFTFEPCPPVLVETFCSSGPESEIVITQVGSCTTFTTDPNDFD